MNTKQAVSGSIVLYKNNEDVLQAIHSFLNTPLTIKLFLVDNSPTNALQTILRQILLDERVEYIFNNKNIGYGAAHNIAIKKSLLEQYSYHIVLNPDVKFAPDVIPEIYDFMKAHTDVGLVMPKILYENGDVQYVCKLLPTPTDFFVKRFLPKLYSHTQRDKFEMRKSEYNYIMDVPFLSGCFMALRKGAIEQCGMFDERYFMYAEDIDITRRIHQKFRTVLYPYVSVTHGYEAASYKSIKMFLILFTNISRYFFKWGWFWDKERKKINENVMASINMENKKMAAK